MNALVNALGHTHTGRVRANNQDAFLVDIPLGLLIVADGMGGHAGGEIASQLAVQTARSWVQNYQNISAHTVPATLRGAVHKACQSIFEKALEEPNLKGMGTTASIAWIREGKCHIAHVGDSRLYLFRSGFLFQITHDHSLVQEQVRAGIISREDAEHHHLKNVITRSVGYQEDEEVDTQSFLTEHGDILLLCSDGLHGKVNDAEISDFLRKLGVKSGPELIDLANHRGGDDNITVVIAEIV